MNLDVSVRTLMTGSPQTVQAGDSLTDVYTLMLNGGFHHVPVLEGDALVGMLSASDLNAAVRTMPAEIRDTGVILDEDATVRTMMTTKLAVVGIDAPIREAVQHFAQGAYHALPVMAGGRLVGILTTRDLARHLLSD